MANVTLRGVRKSFGGMEIIHGVDLDIADNELTVFVGPSGCGKSTLLRLIAGLEDITSGEMTIDGVRVNDLPPKERGISMVFQSYALYPHMSVYDNMAFGLKLANGSKDAIDAKVREAARILQIENLLARKPRELSGGQRQRVAIGRAIVREPKVFLFDEPLSNLDAALRVQMRIELAKLKEDLSATMVYVTHDQVEAMTLANKIVVLRAGHVEQVGSPLELYHHPCNLFVAGFIGSPKMNFLETVASDIGRDTATVALPGGGTMTVPARTAGMAPGAKVTLGVRPEHLVAGEQGDAAMDGRIFVVERLGGETYCHVRVDGGQSVVIRTDGDSPVNPGEQVRIGIPAANCHLFDRDGIALARVERHPLADLEMPRHATG
ncbi:sugar ABC transporter ATP-binding protein [Skermanella aerolata]|uniref:Sugar ABC transporter ATP-binding protein n=1 Tax=Skermanella aerolata TaxID=393310 RepID=A0A512DQJ1_9PROT|nr:sn-glycerol-3-phosphate ABC transporter ATP-binding protein UgpC [Skermanella aerolata]KJB95358.1 sugar ABC transporter ATP-binding protein [Skermanella aerolata KACC 11604]GEO38762.1 sugar ABC transporter ATP-binding protein [Skermanella aerolata]